MNIEQIREYCLAKKEVIECFPFDEDTLVFKVAGKMFALSALERGNNIVLKCDPERAIQLREEYTEIQAAWHMNKTHWNQIDLNGQVPDALIIELINHSYDLIVAKLPKKIRTELFS